MADGVFAVAVRTPEADLVDVSARAIVLRSSDGELTVLDGHTPMVTDVVPGDVRIDPAEGESFHLAVHGGYLHVATGPTPAGTGRSTRVTLLAGVAELADQIDTERAGRAREAAQARVDELRSAGQAETPDMAVAEAALRRAEVRLEVA